MDRATRATFWFVLLVAGSLGFFALDRSPTIWFDETAYLEPAWRLATGSGLRSFSQFDGGELGRPFVGQLPLYFYFQAGVIKSLGFSIWTMRGSGILFHLLTALLLFRILRRRFGVHAALAGMTIVLFHPATIETIRSGRMDALAMVLGCASLSASDRLACDGLRRWAVLSGFLMGLAILTHPAVAAMIPAAILLSRPDREPTLRPWIVNVATLAIVAGVCLLPWIVYIRWIEPLAYQEQLGTAAEILQKRELSRWALWLQRVVMLVDGFRFFVLGLLAISTGLVITGVVRQLRSWMFVGLAVLGFHVFVMRGTGSGQIHVICIWTFALAAAVRYVEERTQALPRGRWILSAVGGLLLINGLSVPAARAYVAARQYASRSTPEFARQWDVAIPATATVAGPVNAFYAAVQHNGNYRSISQLFPGRDPSNRQYREALCRARFDYLVVPAGREPAEFLAANCADRYALESKIRLPSTPQIKGLVVPSYDSDVYRRDQQAE